MVPLPFIELYHWGIKVGKIRINSYFPIGSCIVGQLMTYEYTEYLKNTHEFGFKILDFKCNLDTKLGINVTDG